MQWWDCQGVKQWHEKSIQTPHNVSGGWDPIIALSGGEEEDRGEEAKFTGESERIAEQNHVQVMPTGREDRWKVRKGPSYGIKSPHKRSNSSVRKGQLKPERIGDPKHFKGVERSMEQPPNDWLSWWTEEEKTILRMMSVVEGVRRGVRD